MSSYRSSYIPWQSSLSNNASKANSKDRYGGGGATNTSTRYSPRTSSYNSTLSNNTAKRSNDNSSTSSPTSTTYQSYRKATPSILKKYANFSPSTVSNGDSIDTTRKDGQESKTAGSSIPRCRPFSKFAPDPSISVVETQGLRYGSASRFGSQIARSPIKEKSLPVFGVSSPIRLNNEPPSEKVMVMTRATSPTPPPNSSFLRSKRRENDDERVLVSEGRRTTAECHSVACQTVDTNITNKAPTPPSRASSLNTKFGSSVNTHNHVRPTDLPLRSSSFVRSSYLSPNESNKERLSPNFFQTYHNTPSAARTPSPSLMAVRESLSNLVIESAATLSNHNTNEGQDSDDDDSDTENESSYEEDYPIKCEKESSYSIVSSVTGKSTPSAELSDKPPKYPPSPNLRVRESGTNEARLLNIRTSSMSPSTGSGGGKLDSSSEDLSAKHIPRSNRSDENNNDNDSVGSSKLYPIRKMDSTDVPWWLNSGSGSGSASGKSQERDLENNAVGYRIRKMDSADSPWWCKTPDSEPSSECNQEQCRRMTVEQNATRSSDDNSRSFGYAIRKMDSADAPWWCNSENSSSSKSRHQEDEPSRKMDSNELLWNADNSEQSNDRKSEDFCKLRKFDSDESEWWTENKSVGEKSSTTPSIPEWWNDVKSEDEADGCVENYKSSKILRIKTILPVPRNDNAESQLDRPPNDEIAEQHQRIVHENDFKTKFINELDNLLLYIGDHTNIDELLGTEVPPPAAPVTPTGDDSSTEDELGEDCKKVTAKEVKIHDGSAYTSTIHRRNYQRGMTELIEAKGRTVIIERKVESERIH